MLIRVDNSKKCGRGENGCGRCGGGVSLGEGRGGGGFCCGFRVG